jgi:hypothetical protein
MSRTVCVVRAQLAQAWYWLEVLLMFHKATLRPMEMISLLIEGRPWKR